MTFEQLRGWCRKSETLKGWMLERGATWGQIAKIPLSDWDEIVEGKSLVVLYRELETCAKCGRQHVRIGTANPTKKPIEKIFRSTKKHK